MMNFNKHQSTIYCVLLGIIIGALFIFGAPMDGSFSWADSPRHALNGAFIMDLFKDLIFLSFGYLENAAPSKAFSCLNKYSAFNIDFFGLLNLEFVIFFTLE